MGQVFISYKREDMDRIAPIVAALRDAGIATWWDRNIPPGAPWRQTIVEQLDAADLCIVAWSEASTAEGGRWVIEEAERAAARRAYLGILLDAVTPPFGFTESQAIDLSGWRGRAEDPRIEALVAAVRARLAGETPPRRAESAKRRRRGAMLPWIASGGAALLILAALVLWWYAANLTGPARKSPADFVNEQLATLDCTWAQISAVPPADSGLPLQLSGIASSPPLVHDLLVQRAQADGVPLGDIDVRSIVQGPAVCPQINAMRPFRMPNSDRFQVNAERGSLQRSGGSLSGRVEIQFDLTRIPAHAALLGLDDVNGLEVAATDIRAAPGASGDRDHPVFTSVYDDEARNVRNVGLILVTSDRPLNIEAVLPVERPDDAATLARLAEAARADGWRFELGLVRCGFDSDVARRC